MSDKRKLYVCISDACAHFKKGEVLEVWEVNIDENNCFVNAPKWVVDANDITLLQGIFLTRNIETGHISYSRDKKSFDSLFSALEDKYTYKFYDNPGTLKAIQICDIKVSCDIKVISTGYSYCGNVSACDDMPDFIKELCGNGRIYYDKDHDDFAVTSHFEKPYFFGEHESWWITQEESGDCLVLSDDWAKENWEAVTCSIKYDIPDNTPYFIRKAIEKKSRKI